MITRSAQDLLFEACRELDVDKVRVAIEQGADVNKMTDKVNGVFKSANTRYSPLSLVAQRRILPQDIKRMAGLPLDLIEQEIKAKSIREDEELDANATRIAELLLQNGAEVDTFDIGDLGNTPLHWAIATGKFQLSLLLINYANIHGKVCPHVVNQAEAKDYGTNTPLILALKVACQRPEFIKIAELLINSGVSVDDKDMFSLTALHWAAIVRAPIEFFNLLSKHGAISTLDKFGNAPKQLYQNRIYLEMIDFTKHGSYSELGYHITGVFQKGALAARNNRFDHEVLELLSQKDNNNVQDDTGWPALHRAAFYGHVKTVEDLLSRGCDTETRDARHMTVLELVQYLQNKLTYRIPANLFSGNDQFVRAKLCANWKIIEAKISAHLQARGRIEKQLQEQLPQGKQQAQSRSNGVPHGISMAP